MGNNKSRAAISQCAMNVSIASSLEQISIALSKVRFQGQPGRHLLSLSQFAPEPAICPAPSVLDWQGANVIARSILIKQAKRFPCRPLCSAGRNGAAADAASSATAL
jgi:hypothetical protein